MKTAVGRSVWFSCGLLKSIASLFLRDRSIAAYALERARLANQIRIVMVAVTSGGLVSSSPRMEIAISRKVIAITGRLPRQ